MLGSAQHLSQMDTRSPRLESGLESLGKEQEPSWQDANFSVAKEQLVEEYFFGQSNLEDAADYSNTSDCSSQLSPKSSSCHAEKKERSVKKDGEYGRRAVFVVLTGGHTKPAAPLTAEAEEMLLARAKEVEELLNIWQPSLVHISSVAKKVGPALVYHNLCFIQITFSAGEARCHFCNLKQCQGGLQGNT